MKFSRMLEDISPKALLSFLSTTFLRKHKNTISAASKDEVASKITFLKSQYATNSNINFKIEGIISSIKANNAAMLKFIIDELTLDGIQLNDECITSIIYIASGLGRVKILEVLRESLGAKLVEENPLAKALLSHPCRELINNLCSEHLHGLGEFHGNFDTDMSLLLAFVKSTQCFPNDNKRQEFDSAIILNELDVDGFVKYLQSLKDVYTYTNPVSLASSFLIARHYLTSGEVIIHKKDGRVVVTVLCFDLQDTLALQNKNLTSYFNAIRKVFPEANFYVSESKLPFPSDQCNVFDLLQALQSLHNNTVEVLAFAKDNVSKIVAVSTENGVYHYQIFKTPLQLSLALHAEYSDINSTVVTRGGFMGVTSKQSINRFYDPKLHHHSVDAYVEGRMSSREGNQNDGAYKLVVWLVNQSEAELKQAMHQHTIAVFNGELL